MTNAEQITKVDDTAGRWDPLVRGAALGAAVVLIVFLVVVGILYFSSDYEFARAAPAPAAGEPSAPSSPPASDGLVAEGLAVVEMNGCTGCHSIDGSVIVGPTWQGLIGRSRTFTDGTSLVADGAYVTRSIRDPGAQVVEGFPDGVMPTDFGTRLSDTEIEAVVAYISSLG